MQRGRIPFESLCKTVNTRKLLSYYRDSQHSPESKNAKASNHNSARKSTLALLVYGPQGGKDVFAVYSRLSKPGEGVGIYIEARYNSQQVRMGG